jgi:hypothetical protein
MFVQVVLIVVLNISGTIDNELFKDALKRENILKNELNEKKFMHQLLHRIFEK